MAKKLLIMRHAQSSTAEPHTTDFQRSLNRRGLADAQAMARLLIAEGLVPEHIFHSAANRTTMTAKILATGFQAKSDTHVPLSSVEDLYLARPQAYIDLLAGRASGQHQIVMLLGHNPGIEQLIQSLTEQRLTMPTSAIVHVELEIETWAEVAELSKHSCSLIDSWSP